jgi:hypothetical protein
VTMTIVYCVFDSLEASVDACETAANVLEGIGLRRAR